MENEICVCGDAPESHDESGCLREGCTCQGFRTAKQATQMLPEITTPVTSGGRFFGGNKKICPDFVRREGFTVMCKSPLNEDGDCTNDIDEHISE